MYDSELKKLLVETCPVRPGQEERAWASLRDRLYVNPTAATRRFPIWRWATAGGVLAAVAISAGMYFVDRPEPISVADSEAPGVYATCFYSAPARAQVVWLNGLDPASNGPTYMDPTTVINPLAKPGSINDPNSL